MDKGLDPKALKFVRSYLGRSITLLQLRRWIVDAAMAHGFDEPCAPGAHEFIHQIDFFLIEHENSGLNENELQDELGRECSALGRN
jgi:hypothetical protein